MPPRSAKPRVSTPHTICSFLCFFAFLVLCLRADPVAAQPGPPPVQPGAHLTFQSLTRADGLAHPSVRSILQDQQGFMWFGTNAGLNRYDGYRFAFFDGDPDVSSGPGVVNVPTLAKDHDGVLWVGTVGVGLLAYDPRTERFTQVKLDAQESASRLEIRSMAVDRSGALWFGNMGSGLTRRDPATGQLTHYRHDAADPTSLSSDNVVAIVADRDGALWLGTPSSGLDRLDPATGKFTHYRHDPDDPASLSSDRVQTVYQDRAGRLWVGMTGGGLDRLDPGTDRFTHYRHDPDRAGSLSNDNVSSIHEDRNGALWIGTVGGGLNRLDPTTGAFVAYRHESDDPLSLKDNSVWTLYEDASGLLWIGTDAGISFIKLYNWPFERYMSGSDRPNSLPEGPIRGMAAAPDGSVWISSYGAGVNRFDPRTQQFENYRNDPADPRSLSDNLVRVVYVDRAGVPWFGTDGGYLNRFDRESDSFTRFRLDAQNNYPIRGIYQDRSGLFWIGSDGGGLNRFDPRTGAVSTYRNDPSNPNSLSYNHVLEVREDQEGILWIGTFGDGLNRFDRATGTFTVYRNDPSNPRSLSQNVVTMLFVDRRGTLWVGTGSGLNRFDRATGSFTRYTTAQGLIDNLIDGIVEVDGALWIATLNGLSRLDPQSSTFRNYNTVDTQLSQGFTVNSMTLASDGTIYAGGFGGFVSFKPALTAKESFVAPVVFTNFQASSQPTANTDSSAPNQAIDASESLTLPRGERTFGIEFAALDYWLPEHNRYRYMLEGVDQDWIEVDSQRRFVTYANLRPGTYTLRVTAANDEGEWSTQPRALAITIAPFWWETAWFAVGLALMTALIVAGGLRFRIHRMRMNQEHLTDLVGERTSELSERTDALMRSNWQLLEQIAERERAEAELRQSHAGLATLLSASEELALEIDVDQLPDRILEQLARIVSYACAIFSALDGDVVEIRAARGFASDVRGHAFDVASVPPASELIAKREPMVMADLQAESSALELVEAVFGERIQQHSWMGVPLIVNDEVIGILSVLHDEIGYYRQADQQRVQIFANLAAIALENARLSEIGRASAVLEERSRIARDLHDAVSQTLFSASLIAEGLRDGRKLPAAQERQGLEDLRRLTRGALAEMRALLYELHPGGLAEKPLGHLLDSLCLAFTSRSHIPVALSVTGSDRLQSEVQEMLYRIAQEALNNISKHAAANAVRVALTSSPEEVTLTIADDGRGFDVASQSHASLGLGIMRERAAKIGAQLRIESHVGSGTTITVVWRPSSPHRAARSLPQQ